MCGLDFIQAAEPAAPAAVPAEKPAAPAAAPPSDKVRITFTVWPPSLKAMVYWGRQRLGLIAPHQPLVIERPRDSGPLDVIVRASGFLPVQTRAYTFADSKVAVKMTPPDQKKTLLGYRESRRPTPERLRPRRRVTVLTQASCADTRRCMRPSLRQ